MPHDARALARAARARARERGEPYTAARQAVLAIRRRMEKNGQTGLDPECTFGTFVIGSGNRFAYAAAVAVAEAPGVAYNPLVIYGGSRPGRRHLLHAIGHCARALHPHLNVRCASSEAFTSDFIDAARDGTLDEFRRRLRDPDLLLVENIQFLGTEAAAQEEFFRTVSAVSNAGRQVVITSDQRPRRLVSLDGRLRAQLEWGLVIEVQP